MQFLVIAKLQMLISLKAISLSHLFIIHILKKGRHDVTDCVAEITAERVETVPKVFSRIHVHFVVTGRQLKETVVMRAIQLSAEKYCSASIMLEKSVEITHDFELIELDNH